jgi:hypothetical protein
MNGLPRLAFLPAAIKAALALTIGLALAVPAAAASFQVRRGINLDIWTSWPDESRWGDPAALLPFPEWRRTVGPTQLTALRAAGFDFVRMPVDPSPFLSERTGALRENLFDEVVDAAREINAAGLKVIVDLHLFPSGGHRAIGMSEVMSDPAMFERYLDLVRRMGSTIAMEDPAQVALELMNEPITACEDPGDAWPARLKQLFAAARASATRLTLVLSGGCWGNAEGLSRLDPAMVPDDNVIWSFHSYDPFLLTHQGATWAGDFIGYVTGIPYPPDASPAEAEAALAGIRDRIEAEAPYFRQSGLLSYLDEQYAGIRTKENLTKAMSAGFDRVSAWAKEHRVAPQDILLGEFGMIRQEYGAAYVVPAVWRAAYARDMIRLAEDRGFAWALWSYGGAFGIVDGFDGKHAEPDVLDMVRALPAR